jgi:hypothetical protein
MLVFVLFLVHNVACVSVLSIIDCNEEWMLVFVLCLVHNVACVSVLSISDCNEEWMLVFVLCLVHNVACVSVLSHRQHCVQDTERRQASILHYNHL